MESASKWTLVGQNTCRSQDHFTFLITDSSRELCLCRMSLLIITLLEIKTGILKMYIYILCRSTVKKIRHVSVNNTFLRKQCFPKQKKFSEKNGMFYILQISLISGILEDSWILLFLCLTCCDMLFLFKYVKKIYPETER